MKARHIVKVAAASMLLGALASAAGAQSHEVIGYSGHLGEWELTATVTEQASGATMEYVGPLIMTHVGLCTQDGPEQKTGEMRFRISAASSVLNATMSVAGVDCIYSGRMLDSYTGTMACVGGPPVPLKLWVK